MGFYSWNCPCCGNSIRSRHSTNATSAWMSKVVVVFADGDRVSGEYDGYGRVGAKLDYEGLEDGKFAMYHRACWELAGKPEFSAPSVYASDQGYFVGDYDPPCPQQVKTCEQMRRHASRTDTILDARKGSRLADIAWEELCAEAEWSRNNATK